MTDKQKEPKDAEVEGQGIRWEADDGEPSDAGSEVAEDATERTSQVEGHPWRYEPTKDVDGQSFKLKGEPAKDVEGHPLKWGDKAEPAQEVEGHPLRFGDEAEPAEDVSK